MTRNFFAAGALALTLAALAAPAQAKDVTYAVTGSIATDYHNRGFSMQNTGPALSTGFEATFANGFYGGLVANSLDLDRDNGFLDLELELAPYVGYKTTLGSFTLGADAYWYTYHGEQGIFGGRDLDYVEFGVHGSYDAGFATVGASLYYSPDYTLETGDAWYKRVLVTVPVVDALSVYGSVGNQTIDRGNVEIWDYAIGATYDAGFALFGLKWVEHSDNPGDGYVAAKVSKTWKF